MKKNNKKQFKFFAFWSPTISDEQYRWVKECGYTHLYVDAKYGAELGSEQLKSAIELCGKHSLEGIVNRTPFSADSNDYSEIVGFNGANADEPLTAAELQELSEELKLFKKKYPNKWFYVNCPCGLIGSEGEIYLEKYKQLLTENMGNKCVSGDDYPLAIDPTASRLQKYYPYLKNLADMARDTNSEFYFFLQTTSITGLAGTARRPDITDLRFLHNIIASFGAVGFQHFTYKSVALPPFDNGGEFKEQDLALIDYNDEKTSLYPLVQTVIREMQSIADVCLDFKWQGVICSRGNNSVDRAAFELIDDALETFSKISKVVSDKNAILGCFSHKTEKKAAVYAVNAEEPSFGRHCKVTLEFDSETKVEIVKSGERSVFETKNKIINIHLKSGEGAFVIFNGDWQKANVSVSRPKCLGISADGCLTFNSKTSIVALTVNGVEKGEVYNGQNIFKMLQSGNNEICVYSKENGLKSENSRTINYFKPTETSVKIAENYSGEINAVRPYNVWGSGNSVVELIEKGYPEGGSGNVIRLRTKTKSEHDWSAFQFLTKPIEYKEGTKLYLDMYATESVFSVGVKQDPIIYDEPAVEIRVIDKVGKWIRMEVPLDKVNPERNNIIEKLYILTGGDKPYGTLLYLSGYYISR